MEINLILKKLELVEDPYSGKPDDVICLENGFYEKIFKPFFCKNKKLKTKRIIKITHCSEKGGKSTIYRRYRGGSHLGISHDEFCISEMSCSLLRIEMNKNIGNRVKLQIKKSNAFCFYYYHSSQDVRFAFKISILALFLGIVSIIGLLKDLVLFLLDFLN